MVRGRWGGARWCSVRYAVREGRQGVGRCCKCRRCRPSRPLRRQRVCVRRRGFKRLLVRSTAATRPRQRSRYREESRGAVAEGVPRGDTRERQERRGVNGRESRVADRKEEVIGVAGATNPC